MWRKQLPAPVRARVAGRVLSKKEDYASAMKEADDVYGSMKPAGASQVAATTASADIDEEGEYEIAAAANYRGRGRGRGARRPRGNFRGRGLKARRIQK